MRARAQFTHFLLLLLIWIHHLTKLRPENVIFLNIWSRCIYDSVLLQSKYSHQFANYLCDEVFQMKTIFIIVRFFPIFVCTNYLVHVYEQKMFIICFAIRIESATLHLGSFSVQAKTTFFVTNIDHTTHIEQFSSFHSWIFRNF